LVIGRLALQPINGARVDTVGEFRLRERRETRDGAHALTPVRPCGLVERAAGGRKLSECGNADLVEFRRFAPR
jgi:hypothetical protein